MNYADVAGKKLLILGCAADDCQIVETAKSMGIYTIATDNHLDWRLAPAKLIADEAWDISWADIPALLEQAKKAKIDGVMAGYDERRVNIAIQLSRELGKPFYAEDETILLKTFDKQLFKNICKEYGVPVTHDYYQDGISFDEWERDVIYPVVVKPIDRGGSNGIRTCYNRDELRENIKYAQSFSKQTRVVVEELIQNACEVVIYYTFADGEVALSAMCDKYERHLTDGFNSLPDAYLYPSKHIGEFIKRHNSDVIRALKAMGMREGSANLQGFYTEDGRFVFFEMDFRLGGTNTYHFTDYYSGENYLKMLINYSLTGNNDVRELEKADPLFHGNYGCIFTLLSRDGIITEQYGDEKIKELPNVLRTCFYHQLGTKIEVNGSQYPKTFRAYIVGSTLEEIKDTIRRIQNEVHVRDENGENMLFTPFNVDRFEDNNR